MATIETIYRMSEGHAYDISQSRSPFSVLTMVEWIERLLEKRRSRRALLEMSDEQLKDIGLSRSEAHSEGLRRFWD